MGIQLSPHLLGHFIKTMQTVISVVHLVSKYHMIVYADSQLHIFDLLPKLQTVTQPWQKNTLWLVFVKASNGTLNYC